MKRVTDTSEREIYEPPSLDRKSVGHKAIADIRARYEWLVKKDERK